MGTRVLGAVASVALCAGAAQAATVSFEDISGTGGGPAVEGLLTATVTDLGSSQAKFLFNNAGGAPAIFTQFNFDDADDVLLSVASLDNSDPNVDFNNNLGNLPQGTNVAFNSEFGFKRTNGMGGVARGVDGMQYFGVTFNLTGTFAQLISSLDAGGLRIGTHVQALADGSSDTLVSTTPPAVPLPAAGFMLLAGMGGFAAAKRRKKS
ncbi:VPLPA-CTERM sorting domain-containing protein [Litoreibacter sp.]|nr:VPLPA-CTERM sorting domain-containing protein [Litoreibacter sp.]